MKILVANWSWYPSGGDWTYVENMTQLYQSKGYEVIPFSTNNPKNIPSEYENNFVDAYNYKELNKNKNFVNGIRAVKNSIISHNGTVSHLHVPF